MRIEVDHKPNAQNLLKVKMSPPSVPEKNRLQRRAERRKELRKELRKQQKKKGMIGKKTSDPVSNEETSINLASQQVSAAQDEPSIHGMVPRVNNASMEKKPNPIMSPSVPKKNRLQRQAERRKELRKELQKKKGMIRKKTSDPVSKKGTSVNNASMKKKPVKNGLIGTWRTGPIIWYGRLSNGLLCKMIHGKLYNIFTNKEITTAEQNEPRKPPQVAAQDQQMSSSSEKNNIQKQLSEKREASHKQVEKLKKRKRND